MFVLWTELNISKSKPKLLVKFLSGLELTSQIQSALKAMYFTALSSTGEPVLSLLGPRCEKLEIEERQMWWCATILNGGEPDDRLGLQFVVMEASLPFSICQSLCSIQFHNVKVGSESAWTNQTIFSTFRVNVSSFAYIFSQVLLTPLIGACPLSFERVFFFGGAKTQIGRSGQGYVR